MEDTTPRCEHYEQTTVREVSTDVPGCPECLKAGDTWVHLRMCIGCGHVGCCDSSKNHHARGHFESTGHSLIWSAEPGETWGYCYTHEVYTRLVGNGNDADS